jgi:DNA polymerase III subunit epsilon
MDRTGPAGDIERLAAEVERHPDYRVLRRLDTSIEYPALTGDGISRAVILDTETTGMEPDTDKVIELGLVVFEYQRESGAIGRVLGSYNGLEDPGMAIPPESTAIHGITDEMVAGRRLDERAIAQLMEGVALVIAHNAAFDRKFVEPRLPALASLPWACSFREIAWDEAGIGSAKLEYLAYQYGFFYEGHRAEVDCRALLEVLRRALPAGRVPAAEAADLHHAAVREPAAPANAWRGTGDARPTAFRKLLDRARELTYRLWARGSDFDTKDVLKARQYRWNPEERCWWRELSAAEVDAELSWLKAAVYGGRSAAIDVETLDARVRHSGRSGQRSKRIL